MKRPRKIVFTLAALSVGITALAFFTSGREPHYEGRSLTDWLASSLSRNQQGDDVRIQDEVASAAKAIGTNAVPSFVEWLQSKDESLTKVRFVLMVKRWIPRYEHFSRSDRVSMALKGFEILGTNASPAVPSLVQLTTDGDSGVRYEALVCLRLITDDKESFLPILIRCLGDSDEGVRYLAARIFHSRFPDEASAAGVYAAFPVLLTPATNSTTFE